MNDDLVKYNRLNYRIAMLNLFFPMSPNHDCIAMIDTRHIFYYIVKDTRLYSELYFLNAIFRPALLIYYIFDYILLYSQ